MTLDQLRTLYPEIATALHPDRETIYSAHMEDVGFSGVQSRVVTHLSEPFMLALEDERRRGRSSNTDAREVFLGVVAALSSLFVNTVGAFAEGLEDHEAAMDEAIEFLTTCTSSAIAGDASVEIERTLIASRAGTA